MVLNKNLCLQPVVLAAEGGKLYHYNPVDDRLRVLFEDDQYETLMGLAKHETLLYVGAKTRLFRFKLNGNSIDGKFATSKTFLKRKFSMRKRSPAFHQVNFIGGFLYVAATGLNEIWKFDLDLNLMRRYNIRPPIKLLPFRYKMNYNHLNNIFPYDNHYYVCLNWLTSKQYGPSGLAVLNTKMKEVDRFEYGWEAHNFCIIHGKKYVLCGSSGQLKEVSHVHKAGLMVDGELVFEFDPNSFFCKDFGMDDKYVYIAGGGVGQRGQRKGSQGVLFILDRDYNLLSTKVFPGSGGFCGCLLQDKDFTKTSPKSIE